MPANTTVQLPAANIRSFTCEPLGDRRLIKAHSNCIGRGALRKVPELAHVLEVDSLGCLEYDDTQRDDGPAHCLRRLIGARERVSPDRIVLGGSGLDWIPTLAASLGVRRIIRVAGDFHGYDRYALVQGVERLTIPVDAQTHALDPAAVGEAVRGLKDAMLCLTFSVTNPLQTPITRAHVVAAVNANPDIIVLVDGAYRQYGDHHQLAALADEFEQVIYLQVASKDLFLPGARLSWIVPSKRFSSRVTETKLPYPLNTVAVDQAVALLKRHDVLVALREAQSEARDHLFAALPRLGLRIVGGPGPWALVRWSSDAKAVVVALEHRFGILVQQQALAPLDKSWIRISATVIEEAEAITTALAVLAMEAARA